MTMTDLKAQLQAELPELLKQDNNFRQWLEQLIRQTAVTPESFDARFERMLQEFAADRAEQHQRWDEQNRKWDEQNRKNNELLEEIKLSRSRQDQGIGALGARWGIASEHSFRAALKGILEKSFGVEVLNVNEFDDEGLVFGAPDQVEIDIIIKNGTVILCELKSSMSKSDMYTFERKVRYYERRHQRPVQRKLAVSPMVPQAARAVADKLGIEVFSYAEDVTGA
ncbi:MAG: DUF3782 domain-containing protein [Candidatus Competibacteraceae bacterium]|nr:DUF3782 domain-containing protein [Candidatus Competibacteraceae bacterium]